MLRAGAASLALVVTMAIPSSTAAIVADDADDICAPTADPCVIATDVDVVDGSTLDFGRREVRIIAGGQIDTNNGQVTLDCGSFTIESGGTGPALKVRGPNGFGQIDGGTLVLTVNRGCSLESERDCISDSQCQLGACSARVCTDNMLRVCTSDASCDAGSCGPTGRCTGATSFRCTVDEDCFFGTCGVNVCSRDRTQLCQSDDDCNFGMCDVGDGVINIGRTVNANGATAGSVFLRAASTVDVNANISADATINASDGGIIDIESGTGSTVINSKVSATGGGDGVGGEICVISGEDVVTTADIDANGGDFDGGFIEIDATRDVMIGRHLLAAAVSGGGFGGEIIVASGRHMTFTNASIVDLDGNMASLDAFGGDGGALDLDATGNLSVDSTVLIEANGAPPDGFGGDLGFVSGGLTTFAGRIVARSRGTFGAGGIVDIESGTTLSFPATASIDVTGTNAGGGAVTIFTEGDATLDGVINARTSDGGVADAIDIDIDGTADVSGTMQISGTPEGQSNGLVLFEACFLNMNTGSLIENLGDFAITRLRGRELITINGGATVQADPDLGTNRLMYRDPARPPIVNGTVSPAAMADDVDPTLVRCEVCGDEIVDTDETCDDGNTMPGDGCSADCQVEGCIAGTPGYPGVPLCDDGNDCTVDSCNTQTGACDHIVSCDDGVDCTVDSCGQGNVCQHVANDGLCGDDGDPCTTQYCSVAAGACLTINNSDPCDDGLGCTIDDHCMFGECAGTDNCPAGQMCLPATGECIGSAADCGNGMVEDPEECDDGDTEWAPGEFCSSNCLVLDCGDSNDSMSLTASDALFTLRAAVGSEVCDACVCNVDDSTGGSPITASDALRILRRAVGIQIEMICPLCV